MLAHFASGAGLLETGQTALEHEGRHASLTYVGAVTFVELGVQDDDVREGVVN